MPTEVIEKKSANEALNDAITEASKQLSDETEVKVEEPEVEVEKESDDEPEIETPSGDDLDEVSLDEAKRLYKALKDPTASIQVIGALAAQAGLLGNKAPETKQEATKVKREVVEILKEKLPDSYKFLADQIGPALEEVFAQEREEHQTHLNSIEMKSLETEIDSVFKTLDVETKGQSKRLESKMTELSNELLPGPGMSVEKYVRYLYAAASASRPPANPKQIADKIRRNANDIPSRLQGTVGTPVKVTNLPTEKMNVKRSVEWALEQLQKQGK